MSKTKNIVAAGLAILGNTVGGNVLANNNQLADQQDNTKMELVDALANPQQDESTFQVDLSRSPLDQIPQKKYEGIYAGFDKNPESLNWEKIYNIDACDVPAEILKYGMLRKMNEVRKLNNVNPLKYDEKLEKAAQDFANEDRGAWWNSPHPHRDTLGRETYFRLRGYGLIGSHIKTIKKDGVIKGYGENLATISGHTINSMFTNWLNSESHRRDLLSPDVNSVGFGCNTEHNIIVHVFGNIENN